MRQAGRIVAAVLGVLTERLRPGMKTRELDVIAAKELERLGGQPSFKGYRGFPAHLCVSVNDEIVHGIPGERTLDEGDVVASAIRTAEEAPEQVVSDDQAPAAEPSQSTEPSEEE